MKPREYWANRATFRDICAKHCPALVPHGEARRCADLILRDAVTARRFAVLACNREMTADEIRRDESAQNRIKRRSAVLGASVAFEDPRGLVVHLHWPAHNRPPGNTWGGDEYGYGVPE